MLETFLQDHHTARDVFLTEMLVEDELDCLVRPVTVCLPAELDQHTEGDVFVCDHQYHTGCSVRPYHQRQFGVCGEIPFWCKVDI